MTRRFFVVDVYGEQQRSSVSHAEPEAALPVMACPRCKLWSSWTPLRLDGPEVRALLRGRTLPREIWFEEWPQLAALLAPIPKWRVEPGRLLGRPMGTMHAKPLAPVELPGAGWLWASKSALARIDPASLTGAEWNRVHWRGALKPAEPYFEFNVLGRASLWRQRDIPRCKACRRPTRALKFGRRRFVRSTWSGHDFCRLNGGPLLVTERGLDAMHALVPWAVITEFKAG